MSYSDENIFSYFKFYTYFDGTCIIKKADGIDLPSYLEIPPFSPEGNPVKCVANLSEGNLCNRTFLRSVVIPDTVTTISDDAFYNFYYLTSVTIGRGVKVIGANFKMCPRLNEIYYAGTKQEWEKIIKDEVWAGLATAKYVQCIDGRVKI